MLGVFCRMYTFLDAFALWSPELKCIFLEHYGNIMHELIQLYVVEYFSTCELKVKFLTSL
jgi:hypothetical protein